MVHSEIIAAICFFVLIIFMVLISLLFYKMLNILVENKKGSYFYCYWKLWCSLGFFKEFINESDFDAKQKEEYYSLYKRGLYVKRTVLICFPLVVLSLLIIVIL